ncbi:hypothetical protein LXL04_013980 [Taraxacum kok-saghyz]
MIRDLDANNEDYTLKVRIIHLWNFTAWDNPQDIRGIGMILLDEQAKEFGGPMNSFNFGEKKLYFKYDTIVSKAKKFGGPMNSFNFVNYQTILDNKVEQ